MNDPTELYFIGTGKIGYEKVEKTPSRLNINIQTSTDGTTWTNWNGSEIQLSSNPLYVRNTTNTLSVDSDNYFRFKTTPTPGSVIVGGNCNSLINYAALSECCFMNLFYLCQGLSIANNFTLPTTTLAERCYYWMFSCCTSLTSVPTNLLPATTLAEECYYGMFENCWALTATPTLPATTLAKWCYGAMFQYCTSLIESPTLPATELTEWCYRYMFSKCTSLRKISLISATKLANCSCQGMFEGCSTLNIDTEEEGNDSFFTCPDTTGLYKSVSDMFIGTGGYCTSDPTPGKPFYSNPPIDSCLYFKTNSTGTIRFGRAGTGTSWHMQTSSDKINWTDWDGRQITLTSDKLYVRNTLNTLSVQSGYLLFTATGSVLVGGNIMSLINYSSLTEYCFNNLFYNNPHIDNAGDLSLLATTLTAHCYESMFAKCPSLTKAPKLPATTLAQACYNGMFLECTSLTQTPKLPATTLNYNCYSSMFSGCTSLTAATSLPATTLSSGCYQNMFMNCTSLKVSENSGSHLIFTCPEPPTWYTLSGMFSNTGGSFKGKPTTGKSYYYN